MDGHDETCVERYCELAGKAFSLDYRQVSPEDVLAVQENCLRFVLRSRDGEHAGTISHQVEHSYWQTIGTIEKQHR